MILGGKKSPKHGNFGLLFSQESFLWVALDLFGFPIVKAPKNKLAGWVVESASSNTKAHNHWIKCYWSPVCTKLRRHTSNLQKPFLQKNSKLVFEPLTWIDTSAWHNHTGHCWLVTINIHHWWTQVLLQQHLLPPALEMSSKLFCTNTSTMYNNTSYPNY
jgi:hypothetical protein